MSPAVSSSYDVANWFHERSQERRLYLSPLKIQRLLYLAQAEYAGATHGQALMPSVFVVSEIGPIEPNLHRAFEHGPPTVSVRDITAEVVDFLTGVWNQFGMKSVETLNRMVMLDPAFKEAERQGLMAVINLDTMQRHYAQLENQPVRVIQGKRVKPWAPKVVSAAGA
jgi:uncharacterized phage-associated protein